MFERLIPDNHMACDSYEDACKVAEILMKNGNVVMISREEQLYILNWEWTWNVGANRNEVVFMERGNFELQLDELLEDVRKEVGEDAKREFRVDDETFSYREDENEDEGYYTLTDKGRIASESWALKSDWDDPVQMGS